MEVDCDLEDSADDEHSLGWPDRGPGSAMTANLTTATTRTTTTQSRPKMGKRLCGPRTRMRRRKVSAGTATSDQNCKFAGLPAASRDFLDVPVYVADRTALKAIDPAKDTAAFLKEPGREGMLKWMAGAAPLSDPGEA